jgi:RimJ/RimL family protein N-acetyltransferase
LDGWPEVTRWLTPAMHRVGDATAMRSVLHAWREAQPNLLTPRGRWSVQRRDDDTIVGGIGIRLLPPYDDDLELSRSLKPDAWGQGFSTEAARAYRVGVHAQRRGGGLARPNNMRAIATAEWVGMEWWARPRSTTGFACRSTAFAMATSRVDGKVLSWP